MNREGFWKCSEDPSLPLPTVVDVWTERQEFLKLLTVVETSVSKRGRVVAYRGWSNCRICSKKNGNEEYVFQNWTWPQGYHHYIRDHDVIPSAEFYAFIRNAALAKEAA